MFRAARPSCSLSSRSRRGRRVRREMKETRTESPRPSARRRDGDGASTIHAVVEATDAVRSSRLVRFLLGRALASGLLLIAVLTACDLQGLLDKFTQPSTTGDSAPPLPQGTSQVEISQGRITVISHEAPMRPILSHLARQVGFQLDVTEPDLPPLTIRIEGAELSDAIPELMTGLHYQAEFGIDRRTGAHVLHRLVVGQPSAAHAREDSTEPAEDEVVQSTVRLPRDSLRRSPEARTQAQLRIESEGDREQLALLEQLESRDPVLRALAVEEIQPSGELLQRLRDLVWEDPDPLVRVAAVAQIATTDAYAANQGLVDALGDPDRRVVLKAIEVLEFAGDDSNISDLELLLDHRDGAIRQAAAETIEFLE